MLTPDEREAIRHRFLQGETRTSLAECFETTESSIRRACKGLVRPEPDEPFDLNAVLQALDEGVSYDLISRLVRVPVGVVRDRVLRANQARRKRRGVVSRTQAPREVSHG